MKNGRELRLVLPSLNFGPRNELGLGLSLLLG